MQWYEEIMDTAQEAVDYIGSTLSTDGSMEEPTRQVLTDFAAAMDGVAERLSQEKGTLMEKCRRYALNAAWSGQKALAAEDARDAWKYFFYELRPLFLDLRYQLDLEYLVLQHPEVQDAYPGALPGEQKIDVEDIQHNENFNIYCSDELSARKFLSPRVLTWFDEHISQNGLCVYLEGNKLYISLYTDNFIFPTPQTPEEVDGLSIEKEYKELRKQLDFLLNFTKVFQS